VPEQKLQFVLQKGARAIPSVPVADELGEFRLGGNDLGQNCFAIHRRLFFEIFRRKPALCGPDFARPCCCGILRIGSPLIAPLAGRMRFGWSDIGFFPCGK